MQRIRQKIINRAYYLSSHAEDEMLDDELERDDVEHVILKGRIQRKLSEDRRGTRYRIEGPAKDGRLIQVICRFKADGELIIITVYALTEDV
jgi:hypothetical protein